MISNSILNLSFCLFQKPSKRLKLTGEGAGCVEGRPPLSKKKKILVRTLLILMILFFRLIFFFVTECQAPAEARAEQQS